MRTVALPIMNPVAAIAVLLAVVAGATALGLVWRSRTGRVRIGGGERLLETELGTGIRFGAAATIVQFSTEFCGPCRNAERVLADVTRRHDDVAYVEVDLAEHPGFASRFNVVQTPTILLLDAAGGIRSRISGVPRADDVVERLGEITKETHVVAG
jgi:thiol-disulfide isomerase/thioredoxin